MEKTKVVVTGLGVVSGLGKELSSFENNFLKSASAICGADLSAVKELNLAGWAPVKDFAAPIGYEKVDRQIQFAVCAARQAFHDAKLDAQREPEQVGVYLSSSKGGILSLERENQNRRFDLQQKVSKDFLYNFLSSTPSMAVARNLNCFGPVLNFVSACSSGAHSIMMASRLIEQDPDKIILAGSTEASLSPLVLAGFKQMKVLAEKNGGAPEKSFRPFDKQRAGFLAGEGAAVLVLESEESARKRGAKIYCRLAGCGAGADPFHMTRLHPTGKNVARVVERACQNAHLGVASIDYVNLHGTATKENDMIEIRAIKQLWRSNRSPLFSATKPMTGHLLGASGAVEALICVLAIKNKWVPPTLNLEEPDKEIESCFFPVIGNSTLLKAVLSLSYGFGGHIGALIFKRI